MGSFCGLHLSIVWTEDRGILRTTDFRIVSATLCICFALLYFTPDKQSASWVFTHFTDGSGWGSKLFSFFLGFLAVAWTMTDYDGTTQ